jgi:hypothetical protein
MSETKSFWATIPGILTAIAGVLSGMAALIVALNAAGIIGFKTPENPNSPPPSPATYTRNAPDKSSPNSTIPAPSNSPKESPPPTREAIFVKNSSKHIGANQWDWTVYIDADSETLSSISCVEYTLHPTFPSPVRRTCNRANNFSLDASGWGTFEIKVRVLFKNGTEKYLAHMLELG